MMWSKSVRRAVLLFTIVTGPLGCDPDSFNASEPDPELGGTRTVELDFLDHPRVLTGRLPATRGNALHVPCLAGFQPSGPRQAYAMTLDAPGQIVAEIDVLSGADFLVGIFDGDEDARCISGDTRRAVATDLSPGLYTIIVFGTPNASGDATYRLSVEPELYDQWVSRTIAPGIVWERWYGQSTPLSINAIRVSKAAIDRGYSPEAVFLDGRCDSVDDMGRDRGALFGINASGHAVPHSREEIDAGIGTRICRPDYGLVKIDGEVHARNTGHQMSFGIDADKGLHFDVVRNQEDWVDMRDAFGGAPGLVPSADVFDADGSAPRTAMGETADGELVLITVDGRTHLGDGLTLPETAELLESFGVVRGLNLDGGGSTTMWINNTTLSGIVNYPSDGWTGDGHVTHDRPRLVSTGLFFFDN